jgi:hypothetical protein
MLHLLPALTSTDSVEGTKRVSLNVRRAELLHPLQCTDYTYPGFHQYSASTLKLHKP